MKNKLYSLTIIAGGIEMPTCMGDINSIKPGIETMFAGRAETFRNNEEDEETLEEYLVELNETQSRVFEALNQIASGERTMYQFNTSTESWDSEDICLISEVKFAPNTIIRPTSDCTVQYVINDENAIAKNGEDIDPLILNVREGDYGVKVAPAQYDQAGADCPIAVVYYNRELKVLVYDDASDDPAYAIPVSKTCNSLYGNSEDDSPEYSTGLKM